MERELWRWVRWGLRRLPRWWPRGAVYGNREVLAVVLWAALHNRPVSWACRRDAWPMQAWRGRLPDQSTMSRRRRDPRVIEATPRTTPTPARRGIERSFGALATWGGGLFALPAWARGLRRVRCWAAAKLALNVARHALRSSTPEPPDPPPVHHPSLGRVGCVSWRDRGVL